MRKAATFHFLILIALGSFGQSNETPTYQELMQSYQALTSEYPETVKLQEEGPTDSRYPLHTVIINATGVFDPVQIRESGKAVCIILNGIHPGEPCGIDASLEFAQKKADTPDQNVVYCIVPSYNIGGMLNRNSTSRVNQQGPTAYGFRGNAKNYDLNRDFIKCDSKNAVSFAEIFHKWEPHVLVDTHTSNGADYQATMTLITSIPERLENIQSKFLTLEMEPYLYETMAALGDTMVPYVNLKGKTPEEGIVQFTDLPRYSTGYASLFNTIAFTTEAHMLKPFDDRVQSTLNFLNALAGFMEKKHATLVSVKKSADKTTASLEKLPYNWQPTQEADSVLFSGYEADSALSEVTGVQQLYYNREKPFTKKVPYYRYHETRAEIEVPGFYVLPGAYSDIIRLLEANDVTFKRMQNDSLINVRSNYINNFETVNAPYEGHYLHSRTSVKERKQEIQFYKGDVLIPTGQPTAKYIVNVLSAPFADSFFNWNYFDAILQQKEYFAPYVFDKTAAKIVKRNPALQKKLKQQRAETPGFATGNYPQLLYIYRNSDYYEDEHKRLPVFEID